MLVEVFTDQQRRIFVKQVEADEADEHLNVLREVVGVSHLVAVGNPPVLVLGLLNIRNVRAGQVIWVTWKLRTVLSESIPVQFLGLPSWACN